MWLVFAIAAAAFWGAATVIDSMIIRRYERNPTVIMFFAGLCKLPYLICLPLVISIHSSWALVLVLFGLSFYLGALAYVRVLTYVDASVGSVVYALQSLFLAMAGFTLFAESWTRLETLGAILIIIAVLALARWNHRTSIAYTIWLIFFAAVIAAPEDVVKAMALRAGEAPVVVLFWSYVGNVLFSLVAGAVPAARGSIQSAWQRLPASFYAFTFVSISLTIAGVYSVLQAYNLGRISLVAIAENTQPFLVILFAWAIAKSYPTYAPLELLSAKSVWVKTVSFAAVFLGLALITIGNGG